MTTHRQGDGLQRVVTAVPPTTRIDGSSLDPSEILHYIWYIGFNGAAPLAAGSVQLVAGQFDQAFDVDAQEVGTYEFYYTTVDTQEPYMESEPSNILTIEILAPFLAAPNPPSDVS